MILRLALSLTFGLTLLSSVLARHPEVIQALDAPAELQRIIERLPAAR